MFTGLIEAVGEVAEVKPTPAASGCGSSTALAPELAPGDSLAVNGVCLTVVAADADGVHMDVVAGDGARHDARRDPPRRRASTSSGRCAPTRGSAATSSRGTSTAPAPSKSCARTATRTG